MKDESPYVLFENMVAQAAAGTETAVVERHKFRNKNNGTKSAVPASAGIIEGTVHTISTVEATPTNLDHQNLG